MKKFILGLGVVFLSVGQLNAQAPVLYRDITPGTMGSSYNFSGHYYFEASDGRIYFGARDSAAGVPENLCYIGTDDKYVKVFQAGPYDNGYFEEISELNGEVFFSFGTNATGMELWKSDGTEAGTMLVKDIVSGYSASNPQNFTPFGGKLYFTTMSDQLYVTDGTESGTTEITNGETVSEIIISGTTMFLNATNTANGNELFKLNAAGTALELVADITAGSGGSFIEDFTPYNSGLIFSARASVHRPYYTDGTAAGTIELSDSVEMVKTGIEFNGLVYFEGSVQYPQTAGAIYTTDGTVGSVTEVIHGAVYDVILVGDTHFFFSGRILSGPIGIYVSKGQSSTTERIMDVKFSDAQASNLLDYIGYSIFDDKLYFIGDSVGTANGRAELFVTDGTAAGSVMYDIDPSQNNAGYNVCKFIQRNGAIYMTLNDAAHGLEPWCIGCTPDAANGVDEISNQANVSIYPNPTSGIVTIISDEQINEIKVLDALGRTVFLETGTTNQEQIDFSSLQNGIYFVRLMHASGSVSVEKVMVQTRN